MSPFSRIVIGVTSPRPDAGHLVLGAELRVEHHQPLAVGGGGRERRPRSDARGRLVSGHPSRRTAPTTGISRRIDLRGTGEGKQISTRFPGLDESRMSHHTTSVSGARRAWSHRSAAIGEWFTVNRTFARAGDSAGTARGARRPAENHWARRARRFRTAGLASSLSASFPTQRAAGASESARRRATPTAASLRATLRLPSDRSAQLTAFFTKLRSSCAPCSISGEARHERSSTAALSCTPGWPSARSRRA